MNRKKGMAFFLLLALLLTTAFPGNPAVMADAAQKNVITELDFEALPQDNTLEVGEVFNFNPRYETELGKGKTTGVVWWEVNPKTNTAGVTSSRWGYVYPLWAGSFEIRALAFPDTDKMNAWRKDNAAGAQYITAVTDWVKIDVTSDREGYALVRTQSQLNSALANRDCTDIHIVTDNEVTFTIKPYNYPRRTLTIDAPNADVINSGRFRQINIVQIKESTFFERTIGNIFHITAPKASMRISDKARIKQLIFAPETDLTSGEVPKLSIIGEGGSIANISITSKGEVKLSGETREPVPVVVEETAAGTKLETSLTLVLDVKSDVVIEAAKEAVETIINLLMPKIKVDIAGEAEDVKLNVEKEAAGAEIKTEVSVEISTKADIKLEVNKGAEDTVIRQDEGVTVEADNKTDKELVNTDLEGNNASTIKPGESTTVTTPAEPTETPSNPSTPDTPTPTPTPTPEPDPDLKLPTVELTGSANEVITGPAIKATVTITDGIACITTEEVDVVSGSAITGTAQAVVNLEARVTMPTGENAAEWEIESYTWYVKDEGDDSFLDAQVPLADTLTVSFDYAVEPAYYYVDVVVKSGEITKTISSRPPEESTD